MSVTTRRKKKVYQLHLSRFTLHHKPSSFTQDSSLLYAFVSEAAAPQGQHEVFITVTWTRRRNMLSPLPASPHTTLTTRQITSAYNHSKGKYTSCTETDSLFTANLKGILPQTQYAVQTTIAQSKAGL